MKLNPIKKLERQKALLLLVDGRTVIFDMVSNGMVYVNEKTLYPHEVVYPNKIKSILEVKENDGEYYLR